MELLIALAISFIGSCLAMLAGRWVKNKAEKKGPPNKD